MNTEPYIIQQFIAYICRLPVISLLRKQYILPQIMLIISLQISKILYIIAFVMLQAVVFNKMQFTIYLTRFSALIYLHLF